MKSSQRTKNKTRYIDTRNPDEITIENQIEAVAKRIKEEILKKLKKVEKIQEQ